MKTTTAWIRVVWCLICPGCGTACGAHGCQPSAQDSVKQSIINLSDQRTMHAAKYAEGTVDFA